MSGRGVDIRCYVIVDPAACAGRDPLDVARAAALGGASIIQLRHKTADIAAMLDLARRMAVLLQGFDVPLVINDRVDVALAAGAQGAHVGQSDLPAETARALMGGQAIIGLSHKREEEIAASPVAALSYAAIGGIFATASKQQERPPIGIEGFAQLRAMMRKRAPDLPVVAISGIKQDNAAQVVAAGADGVAVISAVCAADDPQAATAALRAAVEEGLKRRKA